MSGFQSNVSIFFCISLQDISYGCTFITRILLCGKCIFDRPIFSKDVLFVYDLSILLNVSISFISVLIYNRDDWIKRGLVANSNELYYAILNTYNMGRGNREVGYIGYMTRTGKLSRAYDQRITETKNNLELKGIFD